MEEIDQTLQKWFMPEKDRVQHMFDAERFYKKGNFFSFVPSNYERFLGNNSSSVSEVVRVLNQLEIPTILDDKQGTYNKYFVTWFLCSDEPAITEPDESKEANYYSVDACACCGLSINILSGRYGLCDECYSNDPSNHSVFVVS